MDNPEPNRRGVWRPRSVVHKVYSGQRAQEPQSDQHQRGRSPSRRGRQHFSLLNMLQMDEELSQGGGIGYHGVPPAPGNKRFSSPSSAQWENVPKKIKEKKSQKGNSGGVVEKWRNPDSNQRSAFFTAGPSHSTGAAHKAAAHQKAKNQPNSQKPFGRRFGNQRFQADYTITQLDTVSDWRTLAALDSSLRILLKLQELESSWVKSLHSNTSADVLTTAFEIFNTLDDKYRYGRLGLMKSLFKDNFFATIVSILNNLKTSWITMGIENICSFFVSLRENVRFLLLNDPAFHSDYTLKCALDNLSAETKGFLTHVNAKLIELQGKEDKRLIEELSQFEDLYSIKSIQMKVVEESVYPDNFLEPYNVFPNIVQGSYQSDDHYVKTHFSLLKEDFQSVLREGVEQYLEDPKKRNFKIWAYENAVVERILHFSRPWRNDDSDNNKLLFEIKFPECSYLRRIPWKFSKRLMCSSLVVLTEDKFKTYYLALIEHREINNDNLNYIVVSFISTIPLDFEKKKFLLVESKTFFEPYLNSMTVFKTMAKIGVPLKKYVIYADITPKIPAYMKDDTVFTIDKKSIKINSVLSWPQAEDLKLNASQKSAFINALTNEVALIQGPPGTGKTYLAFKIISALLANRNVSYQKGPILIVCYKNHSLDQILSGLLDSRVKVRRIGGQTKNPILKYEANVKRLPPPPTMNSLMEEKQSLKGKIKSYFQEIEAKENLIKIIDGRFGIISLDMFKMANVVDDNFDLDMVMWLMELVDVDPRSAKPLLELSILSTTFNIYSEDVKFYAIALAELAREITKISRECDNLINTKQYHQYTLACEQYWAASDQYQCVFAALNINTDSVVCPDPKSPDFCFDDLDLEERWALYNEWERQLKSQFKEDIVNAQEDVLAVSESLEEFEEIVLSEKLKADEPAVVGVTTTGAAKHYIALAKLGPKIVLVEEAAEVLEAHVVSSLSTKCEHLIMIGDHQQLRPNTASINIGSTYRLNISFFERLINNDAQLSTLSTQHRMRPEIAELICPAIYPNLTNSPSVALYPDVKGAAKNVFFFSHTYPEKDGIDSESKFNPEEAGMVIAVCEYLLQQGYSGKDITILSTYLEHDRYIKKTIDQMRSPLWDGLMTTVVDNYQGEENTIVLLSLVRSNNVGSVGFLSTENRVCVALSRAKHGLFIFGNMECLTKKEPTIWTKINQVLCRQESVGSHFPLKCLRHGNVTQVRTPVDIRALKNAGCNLACSSDLECGHSCRNACHGQDLDHLTIFTCKQPCLKRCGKGHLCPMLCDQQCPPCPTLVPKTLDCGHTQSLKCCKPSLQDYCEETVEVKLERCGHNQVVLCKLLPRIHSVACKAICGFEFSCGHSCKRTCHVQSNSLRESDLNSMYYRRSRLENDHVCEEPCELINLNCPRKHRCIKKCREPCGDCRVATEKTLPCNHKARMPCNQDVSQYTCKQLCTRELPCNHTASVVCNQDVSKVKCNKPCDRLFPCGHNCIKKCYEACGSCLMKVEKTIPECGHKKLAHCHLSLNRTDCVSKCENTKSCGHQCKGSCSTPCDEVNCVVKVPTELDCGHKAHIPCGTLEKGSKGDLLSMCKRPCNTKLQCGHTCRGSCSDCFIGSLHRPCTAPCGLTLVCGHRCKGSCQDLYHTCASCFEICWKEELKKDVAPTRTNKKGKKMPFRGFNPLSDQMNKIREFVKKTSKSLALLFEGTGKNSKLFPIVQPLIPYTQKNLNAQRSEVDGLIFLKSILFKLESTINLVRSYNRIITHRWMAEPKKAELKSMVENIAHFLSHPSKVSSFQMSQLQDLILWVNCNIYIHQLVGCKPTQLDANPDVTLAAAHELLSGSRLAFSQEVRCQLYSLIKDKFEKCDLEETILVAKVFPLSLKWCSPIYHHRIENPPRNQQKPQDNTRTAASTAEGAGRNASAITRDSTNTRKNLEKSNNQKTLRPLVDYDLDKRLLVSKMALTNVSAIEDGEIVDVDEVSMESTKKNWETADFRETTDDDLNVPVADLLELNVSEVKVEDNQTEASESGLVTDGSSSDVKSAMNGLEKCKIFNANLPNQEIGDLNESSVSDDVQEKAGIEKIPKITPWSPAETEEMDQDMAIPEAPALPAITELPEDANIESLEGGHSTSTANLPEPPQCPRPYDDQQKVNQLYMDDID